MTDTADLLRRPIQWRANPDKEPFFVPAGNDPDLSGYELRINKLYPEEPAYTLLRDGVELGDLDDLPTTWVRGPIPW